MHLTTFQKAAIKLATSDKPYIIIKGRAMGKSYVHRLLKTIKRNKNNE